MFCIITHRIRDLVPTVEYTREVVKTVEFTQLVKLLEQTTANAPFNADC